MYKIPGTPKLQLFEFWLNLLNLIKNQVRNLTKQTIQAVSKLKSTLKIIQI